MVSAGAYLPPSLQQAWEDLGVIVLQGYGATETGTGACTTSTTMGRARVGRTPEGIEMRIVEGGGISSSVAVPSSRATGTLRT